MKPRTAFIVVEKLPEGWRRTIEHTTMEDFWPYAMQKGFKLQDGERRVWAEVVHAGVAKEGERLISISRTRSGAEDLAKFVAPHAGAEPARDPGGQPPG